MDWGAFCVWLCLMLLAIEVFWFQHSEVFVGEGFDADFGFASVGWETVVDAVVVDCFDAVIA